MPRRLARPALLAWAACAWGTLLAAPRAGAVNVTWLAQERVVQVGSSAFVPFGQPCSIPEEPSFPPCSESVSDSASAPDFGPFDAALVTPGCAFLSCPPGTASQSSSITLTEIRARGDAAGQSGHSFCCGGGSSAGGSVLDVTFRLDEPAAYELSGVFSSTVRGPGRDEARFHARWMLIGPGGIVDGCSLGDPYTELDSCTGAVESGPLEPGDYTLRIEAVSSPASLPSNFQQASAGFDVSFRLVPEPGTALLVMQALLMLGLRARPGAPCAPESA